MSYLLQVRHFLRENKAILVWSAFIFLLALFLGCYFSFALQSKLREFERAKNQDRMRNIFMGLSGESDRLLDLLAAFTYWKDSVLYVKNPSRAYERDNYSPAQMEKSNIDLVMIFSPSRHLLFGQIYDGPEHAASGVPSDLVSRLTSERSFFDFERIDGTRWGLIVIGERIFLLANRQITDDLRKNHPEGFIIFGRELDGPFIHRISDMSRMRFTMSRVKGPIPTGATPHPTLQDSSFDVGDERDHPKKLTVFLKGIMGDEYLRLEATPPPEAVLQSESSARLLMFFNLSVAALILSYTVIVLGEIRKRHSAQTLAQQNSREADRARIDSILRESELKTLRSQINPHFLFNSLNSLRALISDNPERARQAVTLLSSLMRSALEMGRKDLVPLSEEVKAVSYYLQLEQIRFEERLNTIFKIGPGTSKALVPPMILQTLVENAVKFGIEPRTEGGEILIESAVSADSLVIRVHSPGSLQDSDSPSTRLGLINSRERIKLIFGEHTSLDLLAPAPDTVVAQLRIPLIL
ncbi:MAG: histidine kinase [Verrucomicrobiae bacterium]|nr:histidine kinase [Verrucomicrobiae bacterium]